MSVAPPFRGLWRREALILPDGTRDTLTQVHWLQTASYFADLRVPADLPAPRPGFEAYAARDLVQLAHMQGFAGSFEVEGDFCRWVRVADYQPPGGPPDEAHFTLEGDLLIETGIHAAYREDWRRVTPADAPTAAFAPRDGRYGLLVVAADRFLAVEDRAAPLPAAASLSALVAQDLEAGARGVAEARLGMAISLGRVERQGMKIELSTYPWRAGDFWDRQRIDGASAGFQHDNRHWTRLDD